MYLRMYAGTNASMRIWYGTLQVRVCTHAGDKQHNMFMLGKLIYLQCHVRVACVASEVQHVHSKQPYTKDK